MAEFKSICRSCFHSYVCEQFNEHRECDNKKCHFANDHFVPTTDVVEVVRCKDCKYWGGVTFGYVCRRFSGTYIRNETRENDYCSYGIKRGEENAKEKE